MVPDESGHVARGGDLTTLRERVSALRAGPLDRRLAQTPRPRRSHHRALRRRLCDRIPRGIRCPTMSGGLEGTVYQVRLGTASGKDATDRIRALRRGAANAARGWPAPDGRLSGFYAHQRQDPARRFHDPPQNVAEEIPSQTGRPERDVIAETTRRSSGGRRG